MVEFKDLAGLSQPLTKLIEVVAEGVGAISRPYLARKNTDAKAYEIKTITQAVFESQKSLGPVKYDAGAIMIEAAGSEVPQLPDVNTESRIAARMSYQETKRQANLEKIVLHAADNLNQEENVGDDTVDSDWTSRFFKIAEDITTDEMQNLWGKVLAGEVKSPKTYSLRTLDTLKNITKEEAEIFVKVSKFVVHMMDKAFVLDRKNNANMEGNDELVFRDLLLMEELGLLLNKNLEINFQPSKTNDQLQFVCGSTLIVVDRPQNTNIPSLKVLLYTEIGRQLLNLINKEPADLEYIKKIVSHFKWDGVKARYGEIVSKDEGKYNLKDLHDLQTQ